MNNKNSNSVEFERQKNIKAFSYTAGIVGGLLIIFVFARMTLPPKEIPQEEQYVEIALPDEPPVDDVNLGNNDVGSGNVQPIVTGTPSSAPVSQDVSQSKGVTNEVATKDVETEEHHTSPPVAKATVPNTNKEINNNTTDQTVAQKPQLRRGAQMTSVRGSGNGGNTDAPGYNRPGGQGPGDGQGDKGVFNGNPNGRKYIGTNVYSVRIKDFEGDFDENGKIALDIEVDGNGRLVSASYQAKGSTLPKSSKQYGLAIDQLHKIQLPKMEGGFKETRVFNFRVQ
jgi:hypothetical protein